MISKVSQQYGFELLPQLTVVTVDSGENYKCDSDDEHEQQQQKNEGYYRRYRYHQQPKQQNVNQYVESLENLQMEEQQTKVELVFLKEKIEEKVKDLKRNSEMFRELKSVLVDVERLLLNNISI